MSTSTASAPDTAGVASAYAAAAPDYKPEDSAIFHGLFADGNRVAPLAPVVSALWSTPGATSAAATTTPKPGANLIIDLFRDVPVKGS
jgi:hypothetical protein